MCTDHGTGAEVSSILSWMVFLVFSLAGFSWCALCGSMLFPMIPAAHSRDCSVLISSLVCSLLVNVTQALGWAVVFCVLEKITLLSSLTVRKDSLEKKAI